MNERTVAELQAEIERLMLVLGDRSIYEDDTEPKPSRDALVTAAFILSGLSDHFRNNCEIEPFWGQLSLIWRSGLEKRVKATFGGDGTLSIYHERMAGGRVVDSGMEVTHGPAGSVLAERLAWL